MARAQLKRGAAATAVAIALIGGYEGLRTYSYQDVIGVWTACYGETRGIGPGMKFTNNEKANKHLVLPGMGIRAIPFLLRFAPRGFVLSAVARVQQGRR